MVIQRGNQHLYRILGRYDQAEDVLRRALAVAEGEPGLPAATLVGVCNELGILFKYSGKLALRSLLWVGNPL